MKKSIIFVVLILGIIAILPTIGNSIIKKSIDEKVLGLKQIGIETKEDSSHSSYLSTSRHFEFLLSDSDKLSHYLNINQDAKLNGMIVGVDIKYYNLPFVKSVKLEAYPLKMSTNMKNFLQEKDIRLYRYLEVSFKLKKVLCHVNYNLINDKFDGYIKDIDENLELKNTSKIKFKILKASFNGTSKPTKSEVFNFSSKELSMNVTQKDKNVTIALNKVKSSSGFDFKKGYTSSLSVQNVRFVKDAIKNSTDVGIKDLNFNTLVNKLDTKELEKLRALIIKNSSTSSMKLRREIQTSIVSLFSKGFFIGIDDYSFKSITIDKQNLKNFSLKAKIDIKKDANLAQKLKISPMLILGNLDVDVNIKLSKEIYKKLKSLNSNIALVNKYAKIEHENVVFDFIFKNSKLSVNGKALN